MVLNSTKASGRTTFRPLVEPYGRNRDRMKVEAEILARQLEETAGPFLRVR